MQIRSEVLCQVQEAKYQLETYMALSTGRDREGCTHTWSQGWSMAHTGREVLEVLTEIGIQLCRAVQCELLLYCTSPRN